MTARPASLDLDVVTSLLRRHLHRTATCTSAVRAATGNSQETWFLDIAGMPDLPSLVLRRSAAAGTLDWSDRDVEVAVLRQVADAGLPVPHVHFWEGDGNTLGRAYVVMERSPGAPPNLRDADVCATVADDLGRWLARLHDGVDPSRITAEVADLRVASAETSTRAQLDHWTSRARAAGLAPPLAAALLGWCTAHVPDDPVEPVMLWGDPGPHNVLTDDRGRITALLDWELAHVGHPGSDVGAARWSCLGHLDRAALTDAYERERGERLDRAALGWFEVFACLTRSIMLLDGVHSALEGRSHDPNVSALGVAMVASNLLRAASIAWAVEPTVLAEPIPAALRPDAAERARIVGAFLRSDVLPIVDDRRIRQGVKIAGALLGTLDDGESSAAAEVWRWYDDEVAGRATDAVRRRLVAGVAAERRRHSALVDLYGPTVAL